MEVVFYKLEDVSKPAGQFINSIEDEKLRAKVIRSVKLLEEFGHDLEMSAAGITEKRDTTLWVHHTEGKGRTYTCFPPFVLSLNHQSRNPVDITCPSPFHIGCAITT